MEKMFSNQSLERQNKFSKLISFFNIEILIEIICILFILLYIYAAVSKFIDYQNFKVQLAKSPLLTRFAGWVAYTIPTTEIVISTMLAVKRYRLFGLYAS